jgi:hypothetical protein
MSIDPLNPNSLFNQSSANPAGGTKPTTRSAKYAKNEEDRKFVRTPFDKSGYKIAKDGAFSASHQKVKYSVAKNTSCRTIVSSIVTDINKDSITFQALEDRGNIKTGDSFTYSGVFVNPTIVKNQTYGAGWLVASAASDNTATIFMQRGGSVVDPNNVVDYAGGHSAAAVPTNSSGSPSAAGGGGAAGDSSGPQYTADQVGKAAAFSTILSFPSAVDSVESNALTGQRSMLNDQELQPFIEQICKASLRSYMSMPNGKFYAFYPDYFGGFGRQPYWEINDIEIISGRIDLSDDQLATHVFVVGDTMPSQGGAFGFGNIDFVDEMQTTGVINIFNAFQAGFLNGPPTDSTGSDKANAPDQLDKNGAINFLQKYGARRYYEPVSAVRSPIYETFLAFQTFCMLWSSQFKTAFEFTFMPELFPGGIVAFPEHGLQCYVEEVVHSGSYEGGFTTQAVLSSPAALRTANQDPDREWIHSGMIRAFVNSTIGDPQPTHGGGKQKVNG